MSSEQYLQSDINGLSPAQLRGRKGHEQSRSRKFLIAAAAAGALLTASACTVTVPPSNVAGSYEGAAAPGSYAEPTRSNEQLRSDAQRVNEQAELVAQLAINTLLNDDKGRRIEFTYVGSGDDRIEIATWTNRDARTGRNVAGPEVSITYDPRDGGTLATEQTQTIDDQVRQLSTVVAVRGVGPEPNKLARLNDQVEFGGAYRINAQNGDHRASIDVAYQGGGTASGVYRIDTENGLANNNGDPVGHEIRNIENVYHQLD